jgi:hypothetical protein
MRSDHSVVTVASLTRLRSQIVNHRFNQPKVRADRPFARLRALRRCLSVWPSRALRGRARPLSLLAAALLGAAMPSTSLAYDPIWSGSAPTVSARSICPIAPGSIPTRGLVASYLFNGDADDSSGCDHDGATHNVTPTSNRFGNGTSAYSFNGTTAYVEIPDADAFSVSTTGQLSISVWMRPGTLNFPDDEAGTTDDPNRYVHWLGKGVANQHEWTFRMYNASSPDRPSRTSFYLFNPAQILGAGSYVQESVSAGTWYHYVAVADMRTDTIKLYKNGGKLVDGVRVPNDQDSFMNSSYHIMPRNGTAPVRIGTRNFESYFKGAIDNIYVYNRALSAAEVMQLYRDPTR